MNCNELPPSDFGNPDALLPVMAKKQSSKDAVQGLLDGTLDRESPAAREITEEVVERVLKGALPVRASAPGEERIF